MADILPPPAPTIPLVTDKGHITPVWREWFRNVADAINQGGGLEAGFSGEVKTAKVTVNGSPGTATYKDGILMSLKEAT